VVGLNGGLFSPVGLIFIDLLRWLTMISVVLCTLVSFLKVKTLQNLTAFLVPIIVILNIIFFRDNLVAFMGADYSLYGIRAILFGVELVLMAVISSYYLYRKIKDKDWQDLKKQFKYMAIILPLLMLTCLPLNLLKNYFGAVGVSADDFSTTHRMYIYISILTPVLITYFFRNKDFGVRNAVVCWLALSGFTQYFYTYTFDMGVTGLPLHLCNTAMVLMAIAYLFKCKPVFYFTYFVNVIGAMFAILLPNCSQDISTIDCMHFWFNHWWAFFLPILGISLKIFPRPNFKMIRGAIYIFTLYLLLMMFMNAWLTNFGNVDYFFLQKDFLIDKLEFLRPVKALYLLEFVLYGVPFRIFWLYDLVIWVGYVGMIFLAWIIYAYCYKIADHYAELAMLSKMDTLQIRQLKKEMRGRSIQEPHYLLEVNMIKIEHFSKKYGNSKEFAVKDFNLEVHEGEVFGFLGHNGSGKSTTIKSLVGIQSLTSGRISICGYDITTQPLKAKMQIGYVSDNHAVYEHLTGREYVNYVADLYNVSTEDRNARMDKYVTMFGLQDAFDREIKSYSHGMKQKVMVISSLIHNPKVWVLDEPLTGLDPTSAFQIKTCMRDHADAGNIVFFSSHVIEVVEKICDKIAIIAKGDLKGVYDMKELKEKHISLEDLYMNAIDYKDNHIQKINQTELKAMEDKVAECSCELTSVDEKKKPKKVKEVKNKKTKTKTKNSVNKKTKKQEIE